MFNKKLFLISLLMIFLNPRPASADCSPESYQELLKCAEAQSVEIKINSQKLDAANELEAVAGQFVNPELDVENIQSQNDKSETTASLLFSISLGGKRAALQSEARAEKEKITAESELNLGQLRLDLMLSLHQLNHLQDEIHIEEESVATFSKIVSQFSKRAGLTPEQEVSSTIFKMVISDHQLSLSKLKNRQNEVLLNFMNQTGLTKEVILKNLPPRRASWPELAGVNSEALKSPHLRFAEADLKLAKSQKEKAQAEAWPDIKIGPVIKTQKDGALSENFTGVGLSMPLPLFSINGSGRSYQAKKLVEAELNLQNRSNKLKTLRSQLLDKYNNSVAGLKNSLNKKIIEEKHEKIERLFFNGLVSSSLVIEAHRQLLELEEKTNETEREALEALGQIYILDNQFSGVIL